MKTIGIAGLRLCLALELRGPSLRLELWPWSWCRSWTAGDFIQSYSRRSSGAHKCDKTTTAFERVACNCVL